MNNNGFYNEGNLSKFRAALENAFALVESGEDIRVRISKANSKMGNVASVSTLPFLTCPATCSSTCGAKCYAAKLAALRPSVLASWAYNTAVAIRRPELYWTQVDAAIKGIRFFRFHVSGDIMNADYFMHMIDVARNNPHAQILAFTKRFEIVNAWIASNGSLPSNLHIMFSGWSNLTPVNPYHIPETNVIERGHEPEKDWTLCGGNCFECAIAGAGCWAAKPGETIAFHIH